MGRGEGKALTERTLRLDPCGDHPRPVGPVPGEISCSIRLLRIPLGKGSKLGTHRSLRCSNAEGGDPLFMTSPFKWFSFLMALLLGAVLISVLRPPRMPLDVLSSEPGRQVKLVACTFGTNHLYYFGGAWDRLVDPILIRLVGPTVFRLPCATETPSTVVWVRFGSPEFRFQTNYSEMFRAEIEDTNGVVSVLKAGSRMMFANDQYIIGWPLSGELASHRGDVIRVRSTNGNGAATFRVP